MSRLRSTLPITRCASCGYGLRADDPVCGLCGGLPGEPAPEPCQPGLSPPIASKVPPPPPTDRRVAVATGEAAETWRCIALGLVLAPIFPLVPLLGFVAWFLGSLVHETGHVAIAWFFGQPAFPAIRLDGHAVAIHRDQATILVVVVATALVWLTWALRRQRAAAITFGIVAATYPVLALGGGKEVLFLLGGHLGEIVFGAIFLLRARGEGFTGYPSERVTSAMVGFLLLGRTAVLCVGLMTSHVARAEYAANGSFGLKNDLLRLAHDQFVCPLPLVALLVIALTIAGAAVGLFWPRRD